MHSRHFISARFAIQSLRSVKALPFVGSIVSESESPPSLLAQRLPLLGLWATEMNPNLSLDAVLVAPVGSSRFGGAQACEVSFVHALARRIPSANHSVKRDGLSAAPYLKR
jgi:hypothetical protein